MKLNLFKKERKAALIPADCAGEMPFRVMEQLKQIVYDKYPDQEITWCGFSYNPHYWVVQFSVGDNKSTFAELVERLSEEQKLANHLLRIQNNINRNFGVQYARN